MDESENLRRSQRDRKMSWKARDALSGYVSDGVNPAPKRQNNEISDLLEIAKADIKSADLPPAVGSAFTSLLKIIEALSSKNARATTNEIKELNEKLEKNASDQLILQGRLDDLNTKVENLIAKQCLVENVQKDLDKLKVDVPKSACIDDIKSKLNVPESSNSKCVESFYRDRSVVFKGMPYSDNSCSNFERAAYIRHEVCNVLGFMDVSFAPVDIFYMSKFLVKVRFGCRKAQQEVLERARLLRGSSGYRQVYIRPSLSEKQRIARGENFKQAKFECEERRRKGENVTIRPDRDHVGFKVVQATSNRQPHHKHQSNRH